MPSYQYFEHLDQLRRFQGQTLDRLGLGPQEAPFEIVHQRPGLRLRRYGSGSADVPPVLLVPAPIKQPYIWDLSPERSVVRRALERRYGVYLVEWTEPNAGAHPPGLADYAGTMLDDCIGAIRAESGAGQVALAGHSLGGIFAALHAACRPDQVAALVVVDAPLHFAGTGRTGQEVPASVARVPGSLLSMSSARAAPATVCTGRFFDRMASMASREHTVTHWQVERWTLDELAMSRNLFNDVMEHLYGHNRFMQGELTLEGVRVGPQDVIAPLFSIYQPAGGIVAAESVLAFHHAAGSEDKQLAPYHGDIGVALQHVGPLVGDNAYRAIWPRVFAWLDGLVERGFTPPARS